MQSNNGSMTRINGEMSSNRTRFRAYWFLSALGTLLCLLSAAIVLFVPVLPEEMLTILLLTAVAVAASLGIGIWKPGTTEAPVTARPLGPVVGAVLLLELGWCVLGIITVTGRMLR